MIQTRVCLVTVRPLFLSWVLVTSSSFWCDRVSMETMERIWHTLFRRKKKKYATPEPETGEATVSGRGDKQSVENLGPISDDPQRVTVKTAGGAN